MRIVFITMFLMYAVSFAATGLAKGDSIPNFFVLAMDNETMLDKKGLREEAKKLGAKRVVLSFFATWCVNCKEEFVLLKKNADKLKENGVLVHLVDVGEKIMKDSQKVSDFVKTYAGDSFPFWFDQNANLLKNFGFIERKATEFHLPVIVVMDSDLRVLKVFKETGKNFPQTLWSD